MKEEDAGHGATLNQVMALLTKAGVVNAQQGPGLFHHRGVKVLGVKRLLKIADVRAGEGCSRVK